MCRRLVFLVPVFYLMVLSLAYAGFGEGKAAYDGGDYAKAYKEFKDLAEHGNAGAQFFLGKMYELGNGVPQDGDEALKWYLKAAGQGNADAQFSLGTMYELGNGVPQDGGEALKWYLKAAEQGNADAEHNLGYMYANGRGISQDYAEAIEMVPSKLQSKEMLSRKMLWDGCTITARGFRRTSPKRLSGT